jgi:hypothetical protein
MSTTTTRTPRSKPITVPPAASVSTHESREESAKVVAEKEAKVVLTPEQKAELLEQKRLEAVAKKAEIDAIAVKKKTDLGLTGQFKAAYPEVVRKQIVESILESIGNPQRVNGIAVGATAWTVELALSMLRLMRGEGVQRDISWEQVRVLASCMRSALDDEDHGVKWYDGTNIAVIADDNFGIDSRHRNIAFICCFGTALEIDEMLRIIYNHGEQPVDKEGNSTLDPADYFKLPILAWEVNAVDGIGLKYTCPTWAIAFSIGCKRGAFSVIDGYQKERTAADALCTYPESAHVLAQSGIPAKTMATAIGEVFLRANKAEFKDTDPTSTTHGQTVCRYGSLKVSNPERHPSRAPLYSHLFAGTVLENKYTPGLIANAHALIEKEKTAGCAKRTTTTGYMFDETRLQSLGYYHILAVSALTLDAYEDGAEYVAQLVHDICEAPKVNEAGEDLRPAGHLQRYLSEKTYLKKKVSKCFLVGIGKDTTKHQLRSFELFTAIVLCVTQPDAEFTQSEFIQACQDEQTHRLEGGMDSEGLDREAVANAERLIYGKKTQVRKKNQVTKRK